MRDKLQAEDGNRLRNLRHGGAGAGAGRQRDAGRRQAEGAAMVDAGAWRGGAEKGWLAVYTATEALVLGLTGERVTEREVMGNSFIRRMARERGGEWLEMRRSFGNFAVCLHHDAVLNGFYHDDIGDLVRGEVADYLRRAAALLAEGQPNAAATVAAQ